MVATFKRLVVLSVLIAFLGPQPAMSRSMPADASASVVHGNYVASSQPGCHIAHYDAEWIIEASPFEAEDYGLEPGEEAGMPDIVVDPETRSLR